MDKIIDIKKVLEKTAVEEKTSLFTDEKTPPQSSKVVQKATNPILKKLAQFKNDNLSKKFDLHDLLK